MGDGSSRGGIAARGVDDSRILVGGLVTQTGSGTSHGVYNLEAYEEVAVDTGAVSAEHYTGGVRINFIPRDGGNAFTGSLLTSFANESMAGNNFSQELKDAGLPAPVTVKQLVDINPSFGGPVKRDTALVLQLRPLQPRLQLCAGVLQQERRQPERLDLRAGPEPGGRGHGKRDQERQCPPDLAGDAAKQVRVLLRHVPRLRLSAAAAVERGARGDSRRLQHQSPLVHHGALDVAGELRSPAGGELRPHLQRRGAGTSQSLLRSEPGAADCRAGTVDRHAVPRHLECAAQHQRPLDRAPGRDLRHRRTLDESGLQLGDGRSIARDLQPRRAARVPAQPRRAEPHHAAGDALHGAGRRDGGGGVRAGSLDRRPGDLVRRAALRLLHGFVPGPDHRRRSSRAEPEHRLREARRRDVARHRAACRTRATTCSGTRGRP